MMHAQIHVQHQINLFERLSIESSVEVDDRIALVESVQRGRGPGLRVFALSDKEPVSGKALRIEQHITDLGSQMPDPGEIAQCWPRDVKHRLHSLSHSASARLDPVPGELTILVGRVDIGNDIHRLAIRRPVLVVHDVSMPNI